NIIHRDISPNNILIVNGMLKISDFGLGKDLDMFHSHKTNFTNSYGQLAYCAPEQFMQLKDGDKRSDVYSLGRLINFIMVRDPRGYNHCFRSVTEKATNENPSYRYSDAEELLKSFEKSIAYHENAEKMQKVREKSRNGVFDEDVENYIYELNGTELCKELVTSPSSFLDTLIEFMKKNDKRGLEIVKLIHDSFREYCGMSFSSYDPIAQFAYRVLNEDFPFVAKEISARILNYIAYDVNRFNAQRLIDRLLEKGIEPMIEEILSI
uniref:protein kinase domain-containing protein n=1 Tax=Aeribacillus alveayuensis TaxID=279215 RepID=UPI0005D1335A